MSNCQVRLDITVGDELKREKLNTKDGVTLEVEPKMPMGPGQLQNQGGYD